jgi:hypothetical protein
MVLTKLGNESNLQHASRRFPYPRGSPSKNKDGRATACARIGFADNAKTVLRIQAGAQGGWEGTHKLGTQTEAKFRHGLEFCALSVVLLWFVLNHGFLVESRMSTSS